jgi:hypothetical protein
MRETLEESLKATPLFTFCEKHTRFGDRVSAIADEFIEAQALEYRILQHFVDETKHILNDLPRAAAWTKDTPDIDGALEIFLTVRQRLETLTATFDRDDFYPEVLADELANWKLRVDDDQGTS